MARASPPLVAPAAPTTAMVFVSLMLETLDLPGRPPRRPIYSGDLLNSPSESPGQKSPRAQFPER